MKKEKIKLLERLSKGTIKVDGGIFRPYNTSEDASLLYELENGDYVLSKIFDRKETYNVWEYSIATKGTEKLEEEERYKEIILFRKTIIGIFILGLITNVVILGLLLSITKLI